LLPALAVLLVSGAASGQTGAGMTVAVLDTGIDASHAEFGDRVDRMSFVDFASPVPGLPIPPVDPGDLEDDPDGHGTATASVVAGATLGVAPDASILDLQVDARYTQGLADPAAEEAAVEAMDWLLQNHGGPGREGTRVVVLSFAAAGLTADGAQTLAAQAEALWDLGVAVVVPAAPSYSALHGSRYVLTVDAASECVDAAPSVKPDIVAPGTDVEVAVPGDPVQPGGTATASGTHLAAARAAGALVLMLDVRDDLPLDAAFAILRDTAGDADPDGPDSCAGFGELDVEGAVAAARAWSEPFGPTTTTGNDAPVPLVVPLLALGAAVALRRRGG